MVLFIISNYSSFLVAKIRISEKKTKYILSFLALGLPLATEGTQEREYLRRSQYLHHAAAQP